MTASPSFVRIGFAFQLTSSQGGWPYMEQVYITLAVFQLTSSQGGWRALLQILVLFQLFQLTSSQGGWLKTKHIVDGVETFQLTSSQGGWPATRASLEEQALFNSHPHKEDDVHCSHVLQNQQFSTHILTRRMTFCQFHAFCNMCHFQLTSSQGGWQ